MCAGTFERLFEAIHPHRGELGNHSARPFQYDWDVLHVCIQSGAQAALGMSRG